MNDQPETNLGQDELEDDEDKKNLSSPYSWLPRARILKMLRV